MPLPIAVVVLDLENDFSFFLDDIGISTYCREAMAITLSLSPTATKSSLVILVFFTSFVLVGRRLTRHISKGRISRFILLRVFFFGWFMLLRTL